jgi:catechol 2,3-dioxygenase
MKPSFAIESVQLRVSHLARSLDYYTRGLGFVAVAESAGEARLATEEKAPPILILRESPGAPAPSRQAAGLFHAALLLPNRAALGAWLASAAERGVEFDGFSDHGVSEAIYLSDPDGIGLEFYADRPRDDWPFAGGELAMTTEPLAVPELLAAGSTAAAEPRLAGARWGHLHLRVTHLGRSETFYPFHPRAGGHPGFVSRRQVSRRRRLSSPPRPQRLGSAGPGRIDRDHRPGGGGNCPSRCRGRHDA